MLISDSIKREILRIVIVSAMYAGLPLKAIVGSLFKLNNVLSKAERVYAPKVFFGCVDKSDNKFFDCAVAGGANCIVTTDIHLQEPTNAPVPTMSPWQYLEENVPSLRRPARR